MCSCHPAPPSAIIPITRATHSLHHPVLQLQNHGTANSVQPLTHTQQANGTASSGSVSSPPLPCSTISSQVPVCPIRNDTGDVMPLAQAITQLSFLEFLQHCGVPLAPPQPSQLPVPISLLDAAVQTTSRLSGCVRLINRTRFRVMWQCRRLPTVSISYPWMLPRRRPSPSTFVSACLYADGLSLSFLVFC